ncbi:hypothetical protein QJS83_04675 [Bdellovibrio sp. 22V]|uniref:hypothetical protein n=1 Tax=Bdellovibrio TaxID=958 RepID=UPI0025435E25|nr:hypothetical protein [Bdellovibrio sp. 22V]WII73166.1 hypothetical protein QJS83_04675 [Bdellovibrio sp. 22V]
MAMRIFLFLLLSSSFAWAATDLPRNLSSSDRTRMLQILGMGSAAKTLDNPYPLGGYSGVEVGLSSQFIPAEDLASLGDKTNDKGEYNYYTLNFGKGLYYNIDTMVYFAPFSQSEEVQTFGGQIRWGFYEASFFPLTLTATVYGGGANFQNLLGVSTFGTDLLATVTMDNVAIYVGGGRVRAAGKFYGGLTDTGETIEQDVVEDHTVFGINVDVAKMFIALQIDRYVDSMYSGKIGFRF